MINSLRKKYSTGMTYFEEWFESFKGGLKWEDYFDGVDVKLESFPIFVQFALFKKFFLNNGISIDTREYLYKTGINR